MATKLLIIILLYNTINTIHCREDQYNLKSELSDDCSMPSLLNGTDSQSIDSDEVQYPTKNPTHQPTHKPTSQPTQYPSQYPTKNPTHQPTHKPISHKKSHKSANT
eukprot:453448_1